MILTIQKRSYSVAPWRIGLLHSNGRFQEIRHLSFDRRRDAVPVLAALEALRLPWDVPLDQWPDAVRAQAAAVVDGTDGYQEWLAAVQRQAAPGRREG